ncbi:MAG: hypothetical protein WCK29_04420 [archaeon]
MSGLRLTLGELEQTTKDIFNIGISSFRVLDLDNSSAIEYKRAFDSLDIPNLSTKIDGPSLQNDPLNEVVKYSVVVYRKG